MKENNSQIPKIAFCPKCGASLAHSGTFCPRCGGALPQSTPKAAPAPAQAAANAQSVTPERPATPAASAAHVMPAAQAAPAPTTAQAVPTAQAASAPAASYTAPAAHFTSAAPSPAPAYSSVQTAAPSPAPAKSKKAAQKQKRANSKRSQNKENSSGKMRSFFRRLLNILKNIGGGILTVLIALLLFVVTGAVLINIEGSGIVSAQFLSSFLSIGWVSSVLYSVIALIAGGLICALFTAADLLLNFHEIRKFFLQLSVAFTSAGLLCMIFMLMLSSRQLCFFIAAGEIFAGSILMLLYTIAFSSYRNKVKLLTDLPRP